MNRPRGNSLMMTLISLAVLLLLVAALIQSNGSNRDASVSKTRADELQACATTARQVLLSRLRTFGVQTDTLTLNQKLPDAQNAGEQKTMLSAHYDKTAPEAVIVKLESSAMGASRDQGRDVANTLASTTLGGQYYRVVVTCRHPSSNDQSELEFTFRHGL